MHIRFNTDNGNCGVAGSYSEKHHGFSIEKSWIFD